MLRGQCFCGQLAQCVCTAQHMSPPFLRFLFYGQSLSSFCPCFRWAAAYSTHGSLMDMFCFDPWSPASWTAALTAAKLEYSGWCFTVSITACLLVRVVAVAAEKIAGCLSSLHGPLASILLLLQLSLLMLTASSVRLFPFESPFLTACLVSGDTKHAKPGWRVLLRKQQQYMPAVAA